MSIINEKGVIDEISDGRVVILVGDNEEVFTIHLSELPEGINAGDWVQLEITDKTITGIIKDSEETEKARKRIQEKMNLLRKRMK